MLMDLEQLRLAGIHPQRETLQQIRLSEGFGADLDPHEIAHATKGYQGAKSSGPEWDGYFHASGMAHHHGHAAHELSTMIKSGEIEDHPGHHENAHYAHAHAVELHKNAGKMAARAGAPWMVKKHQELASSHEKQMAKHAKKFKSEK